MLNGFNNARITYSQQYNFMNNEYIQLYMSTPFAQQYMNNQCTQQNVNNKCIQQCKHSVAHEQSEYVLCNVLTLLAQPLNIFTHGQNVTIR